ncbi:2-hydroxychromene-2-carboxylate isomerase [Kineobactrum salinum]|uniref:2-hydroxychromene-2-carboxylate isomerase n=1 Tax=Kineobactrum salinum TaxID=2708301 RepID=A0A6C0U0K2_9GAMM|nr:2-hydroxychromene-2-carboxylate isomerase [Kineobactrum salinum]QIB65099.1 2-hydroxychromene-2-carboxylate isomerase [Kineobactrum salinum]
MTIDFYFDFISPYGWIGAERIGAIARRFGRRVNWHPFLLQVTVMETMGLKPPLETPLKGAYLLHDIKRFLRYHGLGMSDQARFGFSSLAPARAVLWVRESSPGNVEDLVLALYRAHWAQGRDISEVSTVLQVVADLGLPESQVATALKSGAIKTALREETASAVRAGVFGSPTVVTDDEMFWGADRLPMVEAWLERGGW